MRLITFIITVFIALSAFGQKFETGFVYSPLMMSKITFDKQYIIFEDFTSLTAENGKLHPDISVLSTGFFSRYRMRHFYFQAEVNFFENKFRKSISDWKTIGDRYFTYSAIEIPFLVGYTFNPGRLRRFSIFTGLNNKLGRFRTVFFSTLTYTISEDKDHEFYSELPKKMELINKFSNYYIDIVGGAAYSYYALTISIRAEKNLTNLNRTMYDYNANYKDLFIMRLCINFVFSKSVQKK